MIRFRDRQLRRLIRHAYANVRYYRNLFDTAGVRPEHIRGAADLRLLPISARDDLRSAPLADTVARGIDPECLIPRFTSGWSGKPMCIRRTWFEERLLNAFRWRARHYHGLRARDRIANLVLIQAVHRNDHQIVARAAETFGLYRTQRINCLDPPEQIVATLRAVRPAVIVGFPSVLAFLAQHLDSHDRDLVQPRLIAPGGEVLTPFMRQQIEAGFGAPVREVYGSHEFNLLAWECVHTGFMHVCDDAAIVEVLKDDGSPAAFGERGEVVATALFSYASPFIRYRLGDLVTAMAETCECGAPFSTLWGVQGRMRDYFPLVNGRVMNPYDITWPLVQHADWLKQYCLIQERRDLITLRIVTRRPVGPEQLRDLERTIAAQVGAGTTIRCEIVSEIAFERNGKFRVARSLVASHYDEIDWERFGEVPSLQPHLESSDLKAGN